MKKLLLTIFFTLFLSGGASANEVILECKFIKEVNTTYGKTKVYSAQELNSPIDLDTVFKINSKFKTIFSYNRYAEEFEPISRDRKDFKLYWSDNEINWTYKNPILKGTSNTNSLNRNTGKFLQKLYINKTSELYKSTGTDYSESVSQCQKRDKLF